MPECVLKNCERDSWLPGQAVAGGKKWLPVHDILEAVHGSNAYVSALDNFDHQYFADLLRISRINVRNFSRALEVPVPSRPVWFAQPRAHSVQRGELQALPRE